MHVPQRHGCFTAWLYLIIVGGTFGLIGLLFLSQVTPRPGYHPLSPLTLGLVAVCTVASMGCAGGMFLLKRWAFYGYVLVNAALVWVNFNGGMKPPQALAPLFWIACLIGVMQIGGHYKAWGRLR